MPQMLLKVDRYEDAEIYAFDFFHRDGYAEFYNTWECDRTFRLMCPLGLPGKKFKIGDEEFVVRSYAIRVIDGSNVWEINYSKTQREQIMSSIMENIHSRIQELEAAIRNHRDKKADDRCWLDDLALYAVLNDGVKADNRVGDQCAMLRNCERFIKQRTEGGGPLKSYAEFEKELINVADIAVKSQRESHILLDDLNKLSETIFGEKEKPVSEMQVSFIALMQELTARDRELTEKNETIRLLEDKNQTWRWTFDSAEDRLESMSDGMTIVMAARDLKRLNQENVLLRSSIEELKKTGVYIAEFKISDMQDGEAPPPTLIILDEAPSIDLNSKLGYVSREFPWEIDIEFAGIGVFPENWLEPDLSGTPPDLR